MRLFFRSVLPVLALAVSAAGAMGATYIWDGTTNNWHTAHWSSGGPLSSPSYVPGDIYDITNGVVNTVASPIFSGATLRVSAPAGLLSVQGNGTFTGSVVFAGGTVSNASGQNYSLIATGGIDISASTTNTVLAPSGGNVLTLVSSLSGPGVLNKTGAGDLIVDAASTSFTGTLDVVGGRLKMDTTARGTNLCNTSVNVYTGAQLLIYANIDPVFNRLRLAGGTFYSIATARSLLGTMTVDVPSVFDGGAAIGLAGTVNGTGNMILTNATGIRVLTGYDGGSYSGAVRFAGSGLFDLYQTNATIGGLSGTGASGTVVSTFLSGSGTRVLTLQPPAGITNQYGGTMRDGSVSARLAMLMNGPGVQVISGSCSNTGSTAVNGGTLIVNGSLGTGAVTVAGAAAFGGSGTVGGPVTFQNNAVLACEFSASTNSTLNVNGNLVLGANTTLRLFKTAPVRPYTANDCVLIQYAGADPVAGSWTIDFGNTGWGGGKVRLDTATKRLLLAIGGKGTVVTLR